MKSFRLIPFVCGAGAAVSGVEYGAVDLKENGLAGHLKSMGLDAEWSEDPAALFAGEWGEAIHKDLPPLGNEARDAVVLHHCRHLRDQVEAAVSAGHIPVTIGGDHSMGAGSIAGFAKAKQAHGRIGVLWIDAHADLNTPETSHSKALHGMPVAALLGMGNKDFSTLGGETPVLKPEHICYVGLRDVDEGEVAYMKELGISGFYMKDVQEKGLARVMKEALDIISRDTDYLFLSMDIDGLDPEDAPATGSTVSGGLRLHELAPLLADVVDSHSFGGFEIAEYNPKLGGREKTIETIYSLLQALLVPEDIALMKDIG